MRKEKRKSRSHRHFISPNCTIRVQIWCQRQSVFTLLGLHVSDSCLGRHEQQVSALCHLWVTQLSAVQSAPWGGKKEMHTAASKVPEPSVSIRTFPQLHFFFFKSHFLWPQMWLLILLVPQCDIVWFRVIVNILHTKTQIKINICPKYTWNKNSLPKNRPMKTKSTT